MKVCKNCDEEKPITQFYVTNGYVKPNCRICTKFLKDLKDKPIHYFLRHNPSFVNEMELFMLETIEILKALQFGNQPNDKI